MATKNEARRMTDQVLVLIGSVTMLVMLALGCIAWYGYDFATNMVKTELAAQKIYFPPAGSPALDPTTYPGLQQYAGQLVDDGPKAKAYANEYIGAHLEEIAGGKTYSEISTEARKDPDNVKLQAQKTSLFQGETLRGLLLGNGYAYWTMGMLAKYAALAFFAGAAALAVLVGLGLVHLRRTR